MANRTYPCAIEDCENPAYARLLCTKHYQRARKHGAVEIPAPEPQNCAKCGIAFRPKQFRYTLFCSPRCHDASRFPEPVAIACGICGKDFQPFRTGQIYCSRTCSQQGRRAQQAGYRRRELYGVDAYEFASLLAAQDDRCALCSTVFTESGRRGPHLDHDHMSGRARGILCGPCNRAIGLMGDDPTRLRRAAEYLEAAASV